MGKIRGTHSSPGIYDKITDLSYAVNTMGITSLALVGETIKGPAFQPIKVTKWTEYVDYFGGTSAKKFKDSQYPQYELPYIAKSYLKASDQLYVCRVLGLSGYNAGPAFLITASKGGADPIVIAVLRSRGHYENNAVSVGACGGANDAEGLVFDCDEVRLERYEPFGRFVDCDGKVDDGTTSALNFGRFTIVAYKNHNKIASYPVSLNSGEKNYIYNVIGGNASEGSAAVFVEEFYDVMLADAITNGYNKIDKINESSADTQSLVTVSAVKYNVVKDKEGREVKVQDYVTIPENKLTKKDTGKRFLYCIPIYQEASDGTISGLENFDIVEVAVNPEYNAEDSASTRYIYSKIEGETSGDTLSLKQTTGRTTEYGEKIYEVIYVNADKTYVYRTETGDNATTEILEDDMTDYREMFRYASTPWFVSELKGDKENIELKKLFRFHTITDGNYANQQVKVSIANIRPDEGLFDVYVRDFNDIDASPVILESYRNLTMVPGDSRYIGLKIGTIDGAYEIKSKYIMAEIIENDMTAQCIPAGFLGYPVRIYKGESGSTINSPYLKFNVDYDSEIKDRRQYFGVSDITGIDVDIFNYKGKDAYDGIYEKGYTHAFHLDSTLGYYKDATITLDGKETKIVWDTVNVSNVPETAGAHIPVIGTEAEMKDSIYENVRVRKFTACFYGGFDGWDIYRGARTNTDGFKASQYKGEVNMSGGKTIFSKISGGEGLALTGNCITSDYYAYLAGINEFINPERIEINLFATPGIDYVNNRLLVEDALDVIEGRLDALYIPTTPDKPWGASDDASEMFTSAEAADNLEDTSINSYYAATYYPWVKYLDTENNIYINLPATKDVLRNMADVDDKRFPWIAPAGMERGKVDCKKLHTPSTIEDRDNVYDGRINPLIDYSKEGVRVWGNKTMYICEETNPMNRINTVRLVLYMRKLINEASRYLIFDPNDDTLADEFKGIVEPILKQIKKDRGITDYKLSVSQTPEQMDLHEISCTIFIKPTPTLEYIEINYVVTPQGISFEDIKLAI